MKYHLYKVLNPLNYMIPKISIAIFLVFAMAAMVSAIDPSYQYEIYKSIDIKNPCYFNGTYCSGGAACNLTMYNPDNSILINDQVMTNQGNYFQYVVAGNNHSLGFYKSDMTCTDFGVSGSETFYVEVTTGGNLILFIILAISSVSILAVALVMKNEYVGFISGALFILTGLSSMINGIGDMSNMYTDGVGIIALGLGLMFLVAAGYSAAAGAGLFAGDENGYEDSLDSDNWGAP